MRFNKIIYLVNESFTSSSFSDSGKLKRTYRKVYANEYQISPASRAAYGQDKFRLEGRLSVRTIEYHGEEALAFEDNGKPHKIFSSDAKGEWTVLTYGEVIGS